MLIGGVVLTTLLISVFAKKPKECGPLGSTITNSLDRVRRSRIMGGNTVDIKEAPWVVRIDRNGAFECTGTLISKRYVLTAGHCFITRDNKTDTCSKNNEQEYSVCRLTSNNNLPCEKSKKNNIKRIHFHKNFVSKNCDHSVDFAVIKLEKEVKDITPVCLPIPEFGITQLYMYKRNMYYFGYSKNGATGNTQLKYANAGELNYADHSIDPFLITAVTSRNAICPGDSGGPMIEIHDKKAVLVGINLGSIWEPENPLTPGYTQNSLKVFPLLKYLATLKIKT